MASAVERTTEETPHTNVEEGLTVLESARTLQEPLVEYRIQSRFFDAVHKGYKEEPLLGKVAVKPSHFP